MKKGLYVFVMVVTLLIGVKTVDAVSVDEFINHVTKVQNINGNEVSFVSKAEVERYLTVNDISEEELSYIENKFDEGVAILKSSGATSLSELSQKDKDKLEALATEASEETGIKFNINSNKSVTLYNVDGSVFAEESIKIKQTGSNNYEYLYVPAIAIVAVATIVILRKKQNA